MKTKHTKGEWKVLLVSELKPSKIFVTAYDGGCNIYSAPLTVETLANAKLIAAAPDLLEALENIVYWIKESGNIENSVLHSKALRAIKKATE